MLRKTNSDLKVGLTVLAGIIILLGGIILAKGWRLGSKKIYVNSAFETASGIEPGDPVFIKGIKRGTVNEIIEHPNSKIVVRVELFESLPLHKDATAMISMLELMGGKKLEIEPGIVGDFNVDRDTIIGVAGGDLSTIVTFANSLTGTVKGLTTKLDSLLGSVNDLFGGGALKHKVYSTLDNASSAITELRGIIRENKAKVSATLTQVQELTTNANAAISELKPAALSTLDTVKDFLHRSQTTLSRADTLLSGVNSILVEARQNKSLLYKLTIDKDFSHKIDSTIESVHALLNQMRGRGLDVNMKLF